MAKVAVKLEHEPVYTTAQIESSIPEKQQYWWLRKDSEFIRMPKRVRADEPLDLVVQLEPGRYVLGVGPPRNGVRQDLVVEVNLAKSTQETAPPPPTATKHIEIKGKSFVITGDLDAMDRDAAKAWLTGLGAKVTSAVSGNTDYLLVGREPGAKKLEKAAELGTTIISEADLRGQLGDAPAPAPAAPKQPAAAAAPAPTKVKKLLERLGNVTVPKIEALVGVSKFADLGLTDGELWGIAIGPRGGHYSVHINLNDRPKYAIKCSCRESNPCKHGYALLITADRNFVPPVPAPEGHEEASRYVPGWE